MKRLTSSLIMGLAPTVVVATLAAPSKTRATGSFACDVSFKITLGGVESVFALRGPWDHSRVRSQTPLGEGDAVAKHVSPFEETLTAVLKAAVAYISGLTTRVENKREVGSPDLAEFVLDLCNARDSVFGVKEGWF